MISIFSYSIGRGISNRRTLLFSILLFIVVVWKAPSLEASRHDEVGPPPNEADPGHRYSNDEPQDEEDEGLPMDGHLLAGPRIEDSHWSSYSCTCDGSPVVPSHCRNVHPPSHYPVAECGARIFYLIGIHNNRTLHDALYLFRGIRDARNTVLLHFDVKFGLEAYHESALKMEVEACPCGSRVEVASVHNCSWGAWSMNLPTLWSMEKAVREYDGQWDVYINLSGDTLPVYTPGTIADLFAGPLRGINFITSSACETGLVPTPITAFPKKWHKRTHYSYHPANLEYVDDDGVVHHNVTVETYFGSQWMSLTPQWCAFLLRQLERPDSLPSRFRDFLKHTRKLMTDETFIPTMLMRFFPETVPNITKDYFLDRDGVRMYAIRYERMDEHVPSSKGYFPKEQRYEVPESTGMEAPRPWGPYFLGTYDLYDIKFSGALYVRKVSTAIDPNIYRILPVDDNEDIPPIGWPKEVKLSPVPDWKKTVAKYKKDHDAKRKEKKTHDDAPEEDTMNGEEEEHHKATLAVGRPSEKTEEDVEEESKSGEEGIPGDESNSEAEVQEESEKKESL